MRQADQGSPKAREQRDKKNNKKMNNETFLHLLLLFVLALVPQGHAHCHLGKEKVTQLLFYYQETLEGDHPTTVVVAEPKNTIVNTSDSFPFGTVYVEDTPLTETEDPNSKLVGQLQGLSVSAGRNKTLLVFMVDIVFTSGEFNGSSISLFSRNPILEIDHREVAIVGGRGKFRMARGFAYLRIVTASDSGYIVEYDVTVYHYEHIEAPDKFKEATGEQLPTISQSLNFASSVVQEQSVQAEAVMEEQQSTAEAALYMVTPAE